MQNYETCQIFTPDETANYMLAIAEKKLNLLDVRILENSFGEGIFLTKITKRIIEIASNQKISKNEITMILESNIFGYEIDEKFYNHTMEKLNEIVDFHGVGPVRWNLFMRDSLKEELTNKYDLIIGNPPYIKYSGLSNENREFIKNKYEGCKTGRPDYYYAFVEDSIRRLTDDGLLIYLIPSGIYKNTHANKIRKIIKRDLSDIVDYKNNRLFLRKNSSISYRSVTSTIIVIDKKLKKDYIDYHDIAKKRNVVKQIPKKNLEGVWKFNELESKNILFGDKYNVQISIATQLNEAFVIKKYCEEDRFFLVDQYKIEKEFVFPAAKPNSLRSGRSEKIIFPYLVAENNRIENIVDIDLYPGLRDYLKQFKTDLENRKSDDGSSWYEYGRSQGIQKIIGKRKLVLSTILTHKANLYEVEDDCIPYSGIFITTKSDEYSLNKAKKILQSKKFFDYAKNVGILADGNSIRIKVQDIKDYTF